MSGRALQSLVLSLLASGFRFLFMPLVCGSAHVQQTKRKKQTVLYMFVVVSNALVQRDPTHTHARTADKRATGRRKKKREGSTVRPAAKARGRLSCKAMRTLLYRLPRFSDRLFCFSNACYDKGSSFFSPKKSDSWGRLNLRVVPNKKKKTPKRILAKCHGS